MALIFAGKLPLRQVVKVAPKGLLSSLALIVGLLGGCGIRDASDWLARVGKYTITVEEFRERYEDLLRRSGVKDNLMVRTNLLDHMIAERLLLIEAERKGFTRTEEFQRRVEGFRRQALLDAYREKVLYKKVTVSEEELRKAFVRLHEKVSARHLYARTREEAEELLRLLRSGYSFEELAAMTFKDPTLASNGGYLGYFTWGEMDPAFEEVAFSLKVGEVSGPVKTAYGYSIIKVEDRVRNPFVREYDYQAKKKRLRRIIWKTKCVEAAKRLAAKLAEELQLEFNPAALRFIREGLKAGEGNFFLEFSLRESAREGSLPWDETVVTFRGGRWTLRDFAEKAQWTSPRQRARVESEEDLKKFIAGLVVRDELLKRAYRAGLPMDPDVQKDVKRNTERYLIGRMTREIIDTVRVPEEAIRKRYQRFKDQYYFPEEVNVREILVASREEAEELLRQIQQGADFAQLAREHSLREWAAPSGGELGYAPRGRYGALADTIFATPVGKIIGPFAIEGYYTIIQIIGRREKRLKTFEEAREQIEAELAWRWKQKALQGYIRHLREEIGVRIRQKRLQDLPVMEFGSS